jgi:hypothetical protein
MSVVKCCVKFGNSFVKIERIICQELVKSQLKYPLGLNA